MNTAAAATAPATVSPFFLSLPDRDILLTPFRPATGPGRTWILIVPPFAEEMNKCRRQMALTARRLARAGIAVLIPDLTGTGDSSGDFGDASWDLWRADLDACADWIAAQDGTLAGIIGIRFGALPALELAGTVATCRQVVLWQPALSGEQVLTQFLRLRTMAGLTADAADRESVADLVRALQAGETVEVAGYDISPALYRGLVEQQLTARPPQPGVRVHWYAISAMDTPRLGAGNERAAEALAARGAVVTSTALRGDTFWASVETTTCPELIERTAAALESADAG